MLSNLRLSVLKAKHANWIVEIYNKFQSDKGVTIIKSGFRKADIIEATYYLDSGVSRARPIFINLTSFRNLAFR